MGKVLMVLSIILTLAACKAKPRAPTAAKDPSEAIMKLANVRGS